MKKSVLFLLFFIAAGIATAQTARNIEVDIKAFKGQQIYLGYYFGKNQYVLDSAILNSDGKTNFTSKERLPGGIYFVVFPGKRNLCEFVLGNNQQFGIVISDTINPALDCRFINSPENERYNQYQKFISGMGNQLKTLEIQLEKTTSSGDSSKLKNQIAQARKSITTWREDFKTQHPDDILTAFFKALDEPVVPAGDKHPGGKYDSLYAYYYYKNHYWDGVRFDDDRLIRTPFFEQKVDQYFDNVIIQQPDSVIRECFHVLEKAKNNPETFKYYLDKFIRKYVSPKYMGQDVVFLRLYEKYFLDGQVYDWTNEKYKKFIFERYYSLVANVVGEPARDLTLTDTLGKVKNLASINGKFIVLCFWDPTCGHCQKEVPKLDSLFQNKWKNMGVVLVGIMTDGGKESWLKYIREHHLAGWEHWYQTEEQRTAEKNSGQASFRQLYDIFQTPMLYLLDKEKRIIAKRLNYEQLNEFIEKKGNKG